MAALVRAGPDLEEHGIVRWRRSDLSQVIKARYGVHLAERSVGALLARLGFAHNCIVPGAVATERQIALWRTPEMEAEFMATQALKLRLMPEHVAAMALFLASDQATGCTGQQFIVDAGLT